MAQRLVGHHRAKIRTTDADIDDIPDPLAGVPLPLPATDTVSEDSHLPEHLVNLGNDIDPIHLDDSVLWSTQGHMENRPVLGDVDLLTGEHFIPVPFKAALLGEFDQEFKGLVGDTVLGVIEEDSAGLCIEPFSARGV